MRPLHDFEQTSKPDPTAVEYHNKVNQEARTKAIETKQYVTVVFGEDAINAKPGTIGLTYGPNGEPVINGESREEKVFQILELVRLANLGLEIEK